MVKGAVTLVLDAHGHNDNNNGDNGKDTTAEAGAGATPPASIGFELLYDERNGYEWAP